MSDYPMLISNKLHSFRNFSPQMYYRIRLTKKLLGAQDSTEILNTFTSDF